ncbi:MAG: DUF86 domain-containing protein [Bacteroidota bacterium]|nr:MAG: DUF86 domain-containing protein [Bacteroidota bacterium]
MSNRRNSNLLLQDIIDSGDRILRYTENMTFDEFVSNELVIDGVIRNFEIIGEAANRLTDDFKDRYQDIDWHRIRGFRNRIVHDYVGIDFEIVWRIKETMLSEMLSRIKEILK